MVGWNHLAYCETFIVFSSPESIHLNHLIRFAPGSRCGSMRVDDLAVPKLVAIFTVLAPVSTGINLLSCLLLFIDVFPECLIEDIEAPSYVGHMPTLPQFQCIVIPRTTPSWLYDVWPCWFLKSTPFLLVKSSQILIFHKIDLNGLPSGNLLHSCWKWQFIVDLPIENGDFP